MRFHGDFSFIVYQVSTDLESLIGQVQAAGLDRPEAVKLIAERIAAKPGLQDEVIRMVAAAALDEFKRDGTFLTRPATQVTDGRGPAEARDAENLVAHRLCGLQQTSGRGLTCGRGPVTGNFTPTPSPPAPRPPPLLLTPRRCPMSAPDRPARSPLPVGVVIILMHDTPGSWRAELRVGERLVIRSVPAPESALVALLAAYQEEAPPK
jgi:hypothetical protein